MLKKHKFKKLNMIALILLIVGQTMLGPIAAAGTAAAEGIENPIEEAGTDEKDEFVNELGDNTNGPESTKDLTETGDEEPGDPESAESLEGEGQESEEEKDSGEDKAEMVDESETEEDSDSKSLEEDEDIAIPPMEEPFSDDDEEVQYIDEIELNDDDHVKEVAFTVNGQPFVSGETKVSNGDSFNLNIVFNRFENEALHGPEKLTYGPGTKLKYQLPASFLGNFDNIQVPSGYGGVGSLKLDGRYIIITIDDRVLDNVGGVKTIEEGNFNISGNFSEENEEWEKEIDLPGGETFTVSFVLKSGSGDTIKKENGVPYKGDDRTNQKSDRIDWTVIVNTNLANTADNPVFTDTLSSNRTGHSHKYDLDSVKIREIDVKPNGDTIVGEIAKGISPEFSSDDTEMKIELENGKAYQITYTTIPENPGVNENVTYSNEARYNNKSDNGFTSVHFGKAIDKTVSGPGTDLITTWTIQYNGNEQEIPKGTELKDSWTTTGATSQTGKQVLVDDNGNKVSDGIHGIEITRPGGGQIPDYTVSYNVEDEGFGITFNERFDYPITITYKTKPEGFIASKSFTVTNKAEHGHIDTEVVKSTTYNQTSLTLKKSTVDGSFNYETKTMDWKITANQAGYTLNAGAIFVDEFENKNMVLVEKSLVVKIDGKEVIKGTDYELTNSDTEGFKIKLLAATDKEVVIEYTTSFEQIKDVDEDRSKNYPNKVTLIGSGLPNEPSDTANYNSNDQQKNNGHKTGSYNYQTKEFTWTILFNYNSNTLNKAVFRDTLLEEHAIKDFKVEKGSIDSGGSFVFGEDVDFDNSIIGTNEFTLDLGTINQPHLVTYTTVMKDGVLPVDGNSNYSVTNKAELLDGGTPNAEWSRTVTVDNSTKVLDQKNGKQIGTTDGIKWDFLYNTAQSELKNVVIKDTFGLHNGTPNQLIDENSVKVYEATYSGTSPYINKTGRLMDESEYTLEFNKEGATFVLTFEELDHAIYVEYESTFIGLKDSPISNELSVTFNDGKEQSDGNKIDGLNFTYDSHAATRAAKFVIIKTDEATGKTMEGVEFTLKNRNGRALLTDTTDENGRLDFGYEFAEGTYYLEEKEVDGYKPLNDYSFVLNASNHAENGPYEGMQIVNVQNTPQGASLCEKFTLTVKDIDGDPVADKEVTLINKITGQERTVETNSDGQFEFEREGYNKLNAGQYTVRVDENGDTVTLGEVTVTYDGNCEAEVQPDRTSVCPLFTITVNDENEEPRPNVSVTVKDKEGNLIATDTTDENGKINIPSGDLPTGTFDVFEGDVFLGKVDVKYVEGCEADVKLDVENAGTCPNFTLILETRSGNPREGVEVTIRDSKGNNVVVKDEDGIDQTTFTTDENGKVKLPNTIKQGSYDVYEGSSRIGSFEVSDTCEAVIKPGSNGGGGTPPPEPGPTCDAFTITVKEDGTPVGSGDYTFTSEDGETTLTGSVDSGGKITFDRNDLPEGMYTVTDKDRNNVGEIKVVYTDDSCGAELNIGTPGIPEEPGEFEINGQKTWHDGNNEGKRPESITIQLFAGDQSEPVAEQKVTAEDEWKYEFKDLPRYDTDGNKINYTIKEISVEGYMTFEDQFNLTNIETIDISGTKTWKGDNPDRRPNSITVQLFKNVEEDGAIKTEKVSELRVENKDDSKENVWEYSFTDIPKYDLDGHEVTYTIKEVSVSGYQTEINGFDITNTRTSSGGGGGGGRPPAPTCDEFTITVKQDGTPVDSEVELTLKSEKDEMTVTTDSDGKVVVDKSDLPEGTYTAYNKDGNEVGTIKVTYEKGKCNDELNITTDKMCENFRVTIKEDGTPVTSGNYTFTSEQGETIITGSVDSGGKIIFDRNDLPEGTYTVTDKAGNKVGQITVVYTGDSCSTELNVTTPVDPSDPDPEDPTDPTDPSDPDPEDPTDPTYPSKPGKPGDDPSDPVISDGTDKQGGSGKPGQSGDPKSPGKSGELGDKGDKDGHVLPDTATKLFNYTLIGVVILFAGLLLLRLNRRREQ